MAFKTYEEATKFLFGFTNYERVVNFDYDASKLNLRRMTILLEYLGNPHEEMHAVHVTGTKGKGSVTLMIAQILREAGVRVGTYMSPHLIHLEERICLDGGMIPGDELVGQINRLLPHLHSCARSEEPFAIPTFFEIFTAIAWNYFRQSAADVAVMEVGLGGRLDSTNIIRPDVCIITNVSLDHTAQLGDTLPQIVAEKAGIIKSGVPVLTAVSHRESLRVISGKCRELNAPLYVLGREIGLETGDEFAVTLGRRTVRNLSLKLAGEHQRRNAALAVAAAFVLSDSFPVIDAGAIRAGLKHVTLPGRIDVVRRNPTIVVDGAHNVASLECLLDTLRDEFDYRRLHLVFAVAEDKDVQGMVRHIARRADEIRLQSITLTGTGSPRSCKKEYLWALFKDALDEAGASVPISWNEDVGGLYAEAGKAGPGALTCFAGSMYLAGKALKLSR